MVAPHNHTFFLKMAENSITMSRSDGNFTDEKFWKQLGYSSWKRIDVFILAINLIPFSKSGLESLSNAIPSQLNAANP